MAIGGDGARPAPTAAARAVDAVKIYGVGDAEVRALDGVDAEFASGVVHRHHGSLGLGQVDAHALPGGPRLADLGPGVAG